MSTDPEKKKDKSPKDIEKLLAELSEDATQGVASPETIDQLAKSGIIFDKKAPATNAEYIRQLFAEREEAALKILEQFPPPPQVAMPPINSLYGEIGECILFGLNGPAITLSAILVEFALKHAIVDHTKGVTTYDKDEWDRLENMELGLVIKEASELKLIDEDEKKKLVRFKNETRNPYLHYNIKKITTGAVMQKAARLDTTTGEVVIEHDLKAEDNPILWQMAKKKIDQLGVMDAFLFADSVVKRLLKQHE